MMRVSAPGKLMISGEWGVLEPPNPCVVAAVDRYVITEIEEATNIEIELVDFNLNLKAKFVDNRLVFNRDLAPTEINSVKFTKATLELFKQYIGKLKPLKIKTWNQGINMKGKNKTNSMGFGSSAASVVAMVGALFEFYDQNIRNPDIRRKIYKLATIAHYLAQSRVGSGFDIAASTYGGIIAYQRPDPFWINQQLKNETVNLTKVIEQKWPLLRIKPLEIPNNLQLLVAWTGRVSSTHQMIRQIYSWRDNGHQKEYKNICNRIGNLVRQLIIAWEQKNNKKTLSLLRKNELLLRMLGRESGVDIETKELHLVSQIANKEGGAGKLSGAGGGDCGIAISFNPGIAQSIRSHYLEKKINILDVEIDHQGVKRY